MPGTQPLLPCGKLLRAQLPGCIQEAFDENAGVQPSEKGRTMAGQYSYDGWSCVRRMENNEPPLMQCYSNPKKARLTVEVCRSRSLASHAN